MTIFTVDGRGKQQFSNIAETNNELQWFMLCDFL